MNEQKEKNKCKSLKFKHFQPNDVRISQGTKLYRLLEELNPLIINEQLLDWRSRR